MDETKRLFSDCLEISREVGDRHLEADSLNNLGIVAMHLGELNEAQSLLNDSLVLKRRIGNVIGLPKTLRNLGNVTAALGDSKKAEKYFSEAEKILSQMDRSTKDE